MIYFVLPQGKSGVEVILDYVGVLAVLIAGGALIISAIALIVQRKTVKSSLFNDMYQKIVDIEDKLYEEKHKDGRLQVTWYVQLFNAYELFAFYSNRGYLKKDMKKYFGKSLEAHCARAIKVSEVQRYFEELKKYSDPFFPEIREYLRRQFKRELPF